MLIGIDEVGRGAWAGPLLVVAAKGMPSDAVADSKVLTKRKREHLMDVLQITCTFGEGWVSPSEIDHLGMSESMRLGVMRALTEMNAQTSDDIIMDGHINYCPPQFERVKTVIGADKIHAIVSAASVYAKVRRDQEMARLARMYPNYSFEKHVGYGTKLHADALRAFGACQIHRRSFKPVAACV